jgi:hypothetical protein
MKINIALIAVAFFAVAAMFGCNKSGGSGVQYGMNADFNNPITSASFTYNVTNCLATQVGTSMLIEGLGSTSITPTYPYIAISIANWHDATDTFKFDTGAAYTFARYYSDANNYLVSKTGLVFIRSINDQTMSGTFQFVCTDGTLVTNGTFLARRKH